MDACVGTFVFVREGLRRQRKVTKTAAVAAQSANKRPGGVDLRLCSRVRLWGMSPKIESLSSWDDKSHQLYLLGQDGVWEPELWGWWVVSVTGADCCLKGQCEGIAQSLPWKHLLSVPPCRHCCPCLFPVKTGQWVKHGVHPGCHGHIGTPAAEAGAGSEQDISVCAAITPTHSLVTGSRLASLAAYWSKFVSQVRFRQRKKESLSS